MDDFFFCRIRDFQLSMISTSKLPPHVLPTSSSVSLMSGLTSFIKIRAAPKARETRATCVVTLSSLTTLCPILSTSITMYFPSPL